MKDVSKGKRLHISIFGRKNAGKSSLINALSELQKAAVNETPGTTTEPVHYSMELEPVGPVVLIDTPGFEANDQTEFGQRQGQKLKEVLEQTDLALLLFTDTNEDYTLERRWYKEMAARHIPVLGVVNRIDDRYVDTQPIKVQFDDIPIVKISSTKKINLNRLRESLRRCTPIEFEHATIVGDLLEQGDLVVLVSPKGLQAPRYRLPIIHTQLVRDIMDHGAISVTVTEDELPSILKDLNRNPDLIITEADLLEKVSCVVPREVPVTTFSILLARVKGDLDLMLQGARAIDRLKPGDRVLVAEACSSHIKGDQTKEKLPLWLQAKAGGDLDITIRVGSDFPTDLTSYQLVVHCGSCSFNRKQMMSRLAQATRQQVPVTNYGIAMAYLHGMVDRILPVVVY